MEKLIVIKHLKNDIVNNSFSEITTNNHSYVVKNFKEINDENIQLQLVDDDEIELRYDDILYIVSGKSIPPHF